MPKRGSSRPVSVRMATDTLTMASRKTTSAIPWETWQRSHLLESAWLVNRFSMIFNVKSINTVDNAGKGVDGMKRPREPPTGGNRMDIGRILPTEAAAILNVSPQFVRVAMQQGKLPIGTAVQMSSIWTYHISEKLLADYSGKNIEKEIERIRGGVEK